MALGIVETATPADPRVGELARTCAVPELKAFACTAALDRYRMRMSDLRCQEAVAEAKLPADLAQSTVSIGGRPHPLDTLVCAAAGYAVRGAAVAGLLALGRAEHTIDNTHGAAGYAVIEVCPGHFAWENAAGADAVTRADIGRHAWIVDDQTVGRTPSSTRSPAGIITDVDDAGVWVTSGPAVPPPPRHFVPVAVASLNGSTAYRTVAPVAGTIVAIRTVLNGALATGDATVTASIGGAAVTGGTVTITQAGSAAGDIDAALPTAANTVAVGDVIALTVGGTNSASVGASALVEIIA